MIVILNYNIGNLTSIKNMLKKGGISDVLISDNISDIEKADKLILPGVGHFDYGMNQLKSMPFFEILNELVLEKQKPILGICLGAQLLGKSSEEGVESGLGWINAKTVKFDTSRINGTLKIPHMGWSDVCIKKDSPIFDGMEKMDSRFYFVHSYHLICADQSDILVTANHGYEFTAGVEKDNIIGVQFHPEKSHKFGMKLLNNFAKNY